MSIKLSLKEALGRQGKTPDARQDLSDFRVDRFVLFGKEISRPVDLARFLVRCGLSLRKAHDVLERLSSGAWVSVELRGTNPKKIELGLSELGVAAIALGFMNLARRLREAIHLESAAIAPQTSPLIEVAREAAEQLESNMTYDEAEKLVNELIMSARRYENTILSEFKEKDIRVTYEKLNDIRADVIRIVANN